MTREDFDNHLDRILAFCGEPPMAFSYPDRLLEGKPQNGDKIEFVGKDLTRTFEISKVTTDGNFTLQETKVEYTQ